MSDQPTAAPAAPEAPEAPPKRVYQPCPCGKVPEQLMLEVNEQNKLGRALCPCGVWGLEFLRGFEKDPEKILDKAQQAWDSAPRPSEDS